MAPDWFSLNYLRQGSQDQQRAHFLLQEYKLMEILREFSPVLTGSIPLDIATSESDIDICCEAYSFSDLAHLIEKSYKQLPAFSFNCKIIKGKSSLVARFETCHRQIEIFAQQQPVQQQDAYRHMLTEYKLLQKYGASLRTKVLTLKQQGYKTEPAFAKALGLAGDPYQILLSFYP